MNIPQSFLENWMQENACMARFNLGSSIVSSYSLGELRQHLEISQEDLDNICFEASPPEGSLGLRLAIAECWGTGNPNEVMLTGGSNEILYYIMNTRLKKERKLFSWLRLIRCCLLLLALSVAKSNSGNWDRKPSLSRI